MPITGNATSHAQGEATGKAFRDTVDHAIRLKRKADRLIAQAKDAVATAADLSTSVPLADVEAAHRALQQYAVPGRRALFSRLNRRRWGKAA